MSNKKNLPNIPIYIGDWERDCNVLNLESEAAWMRIVFKLWTKGKQNSIKMPSKSLQNLWRCGEDKVSEILNDLITNDICDISIDSDGVEFICRRFVRENKISEVRSVAGSTVKKENKTKSKVNQNHIKHSIKSEQNTDIDNDNDNDIDIKGEIEQKFPFETFWNIVAHKEGKDDTRAYWEGKKKLKNGTRMNDQLREKALKHYEQYIFNMEDVQYARRPKTYLFNSTFEDEIITRKANQKNSTGIDPQIEANVREFARAIELGEDFIPLDRPIRKQEVSLPGSRKIIEIPYQGD